MHSEKFIKTKSRDRANSHFMRCKAMKTPYIRAIRINHQQFYRVIIDMLPTEYNIDRNGLDLIKKLYESEIDEVEKRRIRWKEYWYGINKESCFFELILSDRLEQFCNRLYNIAVRYCCGCGDGN